MTFNLGKKEDLEMAALYKEGFFPKESIHRHELFKEEVWKVCVI